MHDWVAIGVSVLAILISTVNVCCQLLDPRERNFVPKTLDETPTTPPPKPRKK